MLNKENRFLSWTFSRITSCTSNRTTQHFHISPPLQIWLLRCSETIPQHDAATTVHQWKGWLWARCPADTLLGVLWFSQEHFFNEFLALTLFFSSDFQSSVKNFWTLCLLPASGLFFKQLFIFYFILSISKQENSLWHGWSKQLRISKLPLFTLEGFLICRDKSLGFGTFILF